MPPVVTEQAALPPPSSHRREVQAQAQRARALHINALTLIEALHLLALACGKPLEAGGKPCVPSPSQLCQRWQTAGAPPFEALCVLTVWRAVRCRLIGARDLIIESAPIRAWRRTARLCRPRGPKTNWANAVPPFASLAGSSSSSAGLGLLTPAGRPSSSKWP